MPRFLVAVLLFAPVHLVAAERPNILWINAEDIGPALGCYGHPDAYTPNLNRLARRGIRYDNAFATAPICAPARSCLITGLYATSLGTQHLRAEVERPASIPTVAELLRTAGYFTTSSWKTDYNFDPKGVWEYQGNDLDPWRKRRGDEPFFSMITLGVTHEGPVNRTPRYEQAVADLPAELHRDPKAITLPPYWPDTPRTREIWARQHTLITVMDRQVGEIIANLRKDGLRDDTIVFFFGDHGYGLPRAKRWLNDSGLRVPLIVAIPEKFRSLAMDEPGSATDRLVSFVDFAPTTLRLAGVKVPKVMQGRTFLGPNPDDPRKYVYGARDRADDMFECSRAVHDGRYLYVRHFMPHLPYIQGGAISGDDKDSYRELRRLRDAGELPEPAAVMWSPRKPLEELYDLENDPHELKNLAADPEMEDVISPLRVELRRWIIEHRDTGMLTEAEYQIRSREAKNTPYELMRRGANPVPALLETADMVGDERIPVSRVVERLKDERPGVRYWAATAVLAREKPEPGTLAAVRPLLDDESPSVRIAAASALLAHSEEASFDTLDALRTAMLDRRPWVSLEASRAAFLAGTRVKPLVPTMRTVIAHNASPPGSPRPWKDFNYAAFTTWALEAALENCGEVVKPRE